MFPAHEDNRFGRKIFTADQLNLTKRSDWWQYPKGVAIRMMALSSLTTDASVILQRHTLNADRQVDNSNMYLQGPIFCFSRPTQVLEAPHLFPQKRNVSTEAINLICLSGNYCEHEQVMNVLKFLQFRHLQWQCSLPKISFGASFPAHTVGSP